MKLDNQTIEKIAHLARLEIAESEKETLLEDMNKILIFMEKLNELDTGQVKPLVYLTDEVNVMRSDEARHEMDATTALGNAPKQDGSYFRVAKVIKT